MNEKLQQFENKMSKAYEYLAADFATIRAGRANPHILDKIKVNYYGSPTPIQQVGNITVPEPRMIQISPWEKSLIKEIEKAIMASDVGITPNNDGSVIRLVIPELTEERRKELVKEVKKKGEEGRLQSAISAGTATIPLRSWLKRMFLRMKSRSLRKPFRS